MSRHRRRPRRETRGPPRSRGSEEASDGCVSSDGGELYYEEAGREWRSFSFTLPGRRPQPGAPATDELARIGRVIAYDRRGYARPGGEPVRSMSAHTADAAALLECLQVPRASAVVVSTSAGAAIAIDLAVR